MRFHGRRVLVCMTISMMLAAMARPGAAQQSETDSGSPFGIGLQSSWPAYGISGIYDLNDIITLQAVLGALGTVTNVSGRVLFDLRDLPKYDFYLFGAVGLWRYSGLTVPGDAETSIGFGGGGGIELDWARILADETESFPPLYTTLDLGLTFASFQYYNWSALALGVGIHYRF